MFKPGSRYVDNLWTEAYILFPVESPGRCTVSGPDSQQPQVWRGRRLQPPQKCSFPTPQNRSTINQPSRPIISKIQQPSTSFLDMFCGFCWENQLQKPSAQMPTFRAVVGSWGLYLFDIFKTLRPRLRSTSQAVEKRGWGEGPEGEGGKTPRCKVLQFFLFLGREVESICMIFESICDFFILPFFAAA